MSAADLPAGINTGEIIARFLAAQGVRLAFGVISIHNMPMLDAFFRLGQIRFVSARGEAGAANMADAAARVSGTLGVVVTSTGTGAGNAAGALVEAMTAGTPLLHLTGQIDSHWIDKNWGFIHEHPDQLGMLGAVGKGAFRINSPGEAWEVLTRAATLALAPPCGPVSVEIAIDVQQAILENVHIQKQLVASIEYAHNAINSIANTIPYKPNNALLRAAARTPDAAQIAQLAAALKSTQRPLLWLGGGARAAADAVQRLVDLGFGVVTSVQGRGVIAEDHRATLGAFQLQRASADVYQRCDACVIVGSRLRSNETMKYELALPTRRFRVDANPAVQTQAYSCEQFIEADAALALHALADALHGWQADAAWHEEITAAKRAAQQQVDASLGSYVALKNALNHIVATELAGDCIWVRDITLSNTMWGNRSLVLRHPRSGVHALGGGIGQGLQMGIGAAICAEVYKEKQPLASINAAPSAIKTIVLAGDGGFMLNVGELACAAQEKADLLVILMNDGGYGVIKNIQDADYGSRHCYVDLHTPDFSMLCASMGVRHFKSTQPEQIEAQLKVALTGRGPTVLEVDMKAWGPFNEKFAGPQRKL